MKQRLRWTAELLPFLITPLSAPAERLTLVLRTGRFRNRGDGASDGIGLADRL